ncbi:MAG: rod-binding protein [Treponema sp.]|jgi:flagellar protein FlgJ|nr:rod-binding protein [Treponema sp.]
MGVETVGSLYLDDVRLGSSALGNKGKNSAAGKSRGNDTGFDRLLEKVQTGVQPAKESSAAVNKKPVIDKTDKLYEQCEALETFLIKNLINGMRNTVQKSELLEGGFAGDMYEDMLYDEYAKDFTKNARLGFAELAYLELTDQRGKLIAAHE